MLAWTPDRVVALAPDAAAMSAGHFLAVMKKWDGIGQSERAIWGLCQGSGKDPYQARVDLSEGAVKCSCPSRKFPCKHGLGLLLLYAKDAASFKAQDEPGWVVDWFVSRLGRAEKKAEKAKAAPENPADIEAQAKRAAQRELKIAEGVSSCRVWLEDLIRRGLATASGESAATWDRMAARMVDAQSPGLAAFVRRTAELVSSGAGREVRTIDHLGRLHLLLSASNQLATLQGELSEDVRTALGWNHAKEDVLAGPGVVDRWIALGHIVEEDDRLRMRRTWLVGRSTGRRALLLDFAAGIAPLESSIPTGTEFDGELAFYPGRHPVRALVKSRSPALAGTAMNSLAALGITADATIEAGLCRYADALGANPWLVRWPLVLEQVRLVQDGDDWFLVDSTDLGLPLRDSFANGLQLWRLASASGGGEMMVLAEWDGVDALPLSVANGASYCDLAARSTG